MASEPGAVPVRHVAAWVPVTQELLDDAMPMRRRIDSAFEDMRFFMQVRRSRWTDTSRIVMWRPWRPRWLWRR